MRVLLSIEGHCQHLNNHMKGRNILPDQIGFGYQADKERIVVDPNAAAAGQSYDYNI